MTTNGTTPKPRDIWQDAFFEEERAAGATAGPLINPATGVAFNRFDAPLQISAWKTARSQPANPLHDAAVALTVEPNPPSAVKNYSVFAPTGRRIFATASEEVPVAILVGTGSQFNRHGVRTAFEDKGTAVLINVPGIEPSTYGYGLTQAMLVAMLRSVDIPGTPKIRTLGAFSTGYRGVNGIVNNSKSLQATAPKGTPTGSTPGLGLDLSGVRKVIYFDAFYRGDEPAPGKTTSRALTSLHAETGGQCELIIYDVTSGGTPSPLRAAAPKGMASRHIDVKASIAQYNALILARVVDMAIKDGYTDDAEVKKFGGQPVLDLIAAGLPKRGTVASQAGSGLGTTDITSWTTAAMASAASATGQTLTAKLISPQELLGWPCTDANGTPSFGEMQHDAHLFEFYWEHLVP